METSRGVSSGSSSGGVPRLFPWNFVMAGLSYVYARQVGRDEWARPSLSRSKLAPVPVKGVMGSFEERFPLLQRCLSAQPEAVRSEQKARFTSVPANFEFALTVAPEALDRTLAETELRKLAVWVKAGQNGAHVYGAGLVASDRVEETTAWLRQARAAGTKVDVSARDADGRLRLFEYHSA